MTASEPDLGQVTQCPHASDLSWPTLTSGESAPVVPVSLSVILLGLQIVNSVLGTFHRSTSAQTTTTTQTTTTMASTTIPLNRRFTIPPGILEAGKTFYPTEKHLKPEKLRKRLGDNFDSFWMSVEPPVDLVKVQTKERLDTTLKEDIHTLNMTALKNIVKLKYSQQNHSSGDGGERESNNVDYIADAVETWLLQKASCPVYYKWEELGPLFWPRWVRKGLCSLEGVPFTSPTERPPEERSCSWPPGMHCIPSESKRLVVLRWQCRANMFFNHFNKFRLAGRRTRRAVLAASKSDRRFQEKRTAAESNINDHENRDNQWISDGFTQNLVDKVNFAINVTLNRFFHMARITGLVTYQRDTARDGNKTAESEVNSTNTNGQTNVPEKNSSDKHAETTKETQGSEGFDSFTNSKDPEELASLRSARKQVAESRAFYRRTLRDVDAMEDGEELDEDDGEDEDEEGVGEGEDSDNGTENWDKQLWKGKKRKQETKCSWNRLHIPVTDDCYCSC